MDEKDVRELLMSTLEEEKSKQKRRLAHGGTFVPSDTEDNVGDFIAEATVEAVWIQACTLVRDALEDTTISDEERAALRQVLNLLLFPNNSVRQEDEIPLPIESWGASLACELYYALCTKSAKYRPFMDNLNKYWLLVIGIISGSVAPAIPFSLRVLSGLVTALLAFILRIGSGAFCRQMKAKGICS